jgi:hypothetical protein
MWLVLHLLLHPGQEKNKAENFSTLLEDLLIEIEFKLFLL